MTEQRCCEVPGCEKVHYARGMCRNDYQVAKRKGFAVEEMVAYRAKPKPEPEAVRCFIRGCGLHDGKSDARPETPPVPINIASGYVVKRPDVPTKICWQSSEHAALTALADELNAPIEKLSKSLFRISVEASHYMDWSWPENIRKLIAA